VRSRSARSGDRNARALGWSGEQEMELARFLAKAIWYYPRYLERLFGILSILLILSRFMEVRRGEKEPCDPHIKQRR
jgi:hypothetical protein